MRTPRSIAPLLVACFATLISPTFSAAQEFESPVLKVKTRLVVIDVIAQDKKGNPVSGLQASDFRVLEDGAEQRVSVFAFQHPAAAPEQQVAAEAQLLPNHYRNAPHFAANSALNVILLDGLNSTLLNQAYMRDQMIKFLRTLPQGQPVAIYALGRKLRLLQDFTTDIGALKQVIDNFRSERSHLHNNAGGTSEVPLTLSGWAEQTVTEKAPQFKTQIESFAQEDTSSQMDVRVQYTTAALRMLARTLAGYSGRKNLIWITEAVPVNMFGEYSFDIQTSQDAAGRPIRSTSDGASAARAQRSYEDSLAMVANLFASAQVAVYPIDARGLVGNPFFNVANNVSGQGAMGGLAMRMEGRQAEEQFAAHSNMLDIAEKTGGRAFYNRNDIESALRHDMEDGSTYYTLAYYPSNKNWDGRFRKIQVSTARSGVKLRYRLGYYGVDEAAYSQSHPRLRDQDFAAALDPNSPVATALQFEALVTPPSAETANKVVVRYAIDPHRLQLDQSVDGLRHGEVDCAARVFSPKDVEHPVLSDGTRMEAAIKPEVFERINRTWFPCEVKFELKPGTYFLRLAVRDNQTGLLGSVNAQVVVVEAAAK